MINRINHDDGLEEVKAKLNEIVDVLVFDNPMERIEGVAQKHLQSHNREIATTRDELKETLKEVKEKLEAIDNTQKDVAEFKESVNNIVNSIQEKIRQFITFYAQVGIHVKELCDGKEPSKRGR